MIESSIGRIKQHIDKKNSFAIVSAHRQELSEAENIKRHHELRRLIKQHTFTKEGETKIGFFEVIGGYDEENKETGIKEEIEELSYFIVGSNKEHDRILKLAIALAKHFEQDSILFAEDGKVYTIYTRNTSDHNDGDKVYLGVYHYDVISKYYTKIKHHRFVAMREDEIEYSNPTSINEGLDYQSSSDFLIRTGKLNLPTNIKEQYDYEAIESFARYINASHH